MLPLLPFPSLALIDVAGDAVARFIDVFRRALVEDERDERFASALAPALASREVLEDAT